MQDEPTFSLEVLAGVAPADVHHVVINLDPVHQYLPWSRNIMMNCTMICTLNFTMNYYMAFPHKISIICLVFSYSWSFQFRIFGLAEALIASLISTNERTDNIKSSRPIRSQKTLYSTLLIQSSQRWGPFNLTPKQLYSEHWCLSSTTMSQRYLHCTHLIVFSQILNVWCNVTDTWHLIWSWVTPCWLRLTSDFSTFCQSIDVFSPICRTR